MSGRGAWSSVGKDNGARAYQYIVGKPLDGSSKTKSLAHGAVNLGVKAIQQQLNDQGYASPSLVVDGLFGSKSVDAAKKAQADLNVQVDGIVGSATCRNLWRPVVTTAANTYGVDPKYLYGQLFHESSADPGACGYFHEPDRGLIQINTETYSSITLENAHDPKFSLDWSAKRFKAAMTKYSGKGEDLQIYCSIAQHNSPASADTWYRNGTAPNYAIQNYVQKILEYSLEW